MWMNEWINGWLLLHQHFIFSLTPRLLHSIIMIPPLPPSIPLFVPRICAAPWRNPGGGELPLLPPFSVAPPRPIYEEIGLKTSKEERGRRDRKEKGKQKKEIDSKAKKKTKKKKKKRKERRAESKEKKTREAVATRKYSPVSAPGRGGREEAWWSAAGQCCSRAGDGVIMIIVTTCTHTHTHRIL